MFKVIFTNTHKKEEINIKEGCDKNSNEAPIENVSNEEDKLLKSEAAQPIEKLEEPKTNEQTEKPHENQSELNDNELSNNNSQINHEQKNAALLEEREEKIKSIKHKFSPQIANLENQMKASKGKGLISKLLEKTILEQEKQITQTLKEYEVLLNYN